jgi:CRISPR-associated endonuclease/helicase Cas3
MADEKDFPSRFQELTGAWPLSWQTRLYNEHFAKGAEVLPSVIDLPTGVGKTMVMAIWLVARANKLDVPTRLIYVVDRRTVVDQASDLAIKLRDKFGKDKLAISTLRGQLADNREWSTNPAKPAIIIGTVDLIGSALLFSGYRSSYKRRPLEAGLLGQDSLLVLDEAHLSRPFEKLICAISQKGPFQKDRDDKAHGKPMRAIRMSATTSNSADSNSAFSLHFDDRGNLAGDDANDEIIKARFGATKTLSVVESEKPVEAIAAEADKLAVEKPGSRIVVFVRTPKLVDDVRKALEKKKADYAKAIAQLTGTMRGLERDELVDTKKPIGENDYERRVMQRFLKPDNDPSQGNCFLISTSAGEVGFDLNADHLVGDEVPLDSWIQRLGRVNRRGNGDATVVLIKQQDRDDKTLFEKACSATSKLFTNSTDLSPKALAAFKQKLTPKQIYEASSPKPEMVELTDILLDAWSMTSIVEPMPGRPEVAPWIRGIAEELPETVIAWRAELDLPGFDQLDLETIEEWFDTHRVLTHETLSVPTSAAAKWFTDRWDKLDAKQKSEVGSRFIIVDHAGLKRVTVNEVINQLGRKNTDSIRNAELILPVSFGGIERGKGLLDADEPKLAKSDEKASPEEQKKLLEYRYKSIDVADIIPTRIRQRIVETIIDGKKQPPEIIGGGEEPGGKAAFRVGLQSDDEKTVRLVSYVPRADKTETGSKPQTLKDHVGAVREFADAIIKALRLAAADPIRLALELAADWHDHGKNRERWQRLLVFPKDFVQPNQPMGKSGGEMKRDPRGYRHEFGSLREFTDAFNAGKLLDHSGKPISREVFDLAIHLITTHHGRGRPHFSKGGFDPDCESQSGEIHIESIRRFARLQRKYGWWHLAWLENLLRCADAMASADQEFDKVGEPGAAKAGGK